MKALLFILALAPVLAHADQKFASPDGRLVANIQQLKNGEIYVTLEKGQKVLAELNLLSQDAEHGRTLAKAAWSKDSRFFVLTTESSGGHSPWHNQAYFYAAASETFRSIDERSGDAVASTDFTLDAADMLHFQKYDFSRGVGVPAELSLPDLDRARN